MGNPKRGRVAVGASTKPQAFPNLVDLHKSHYGLIKEVCRSFAQAACVAFDRHHNPPIDISIKNGTRSLVRRAKWRKPSARAKASWGNRDDATRDGAYAVSIASMEVAEGLYAVGRTETRTGADYYLGRDKTATDLERAFRLEVSGTDGGESEAASRLKQKKVQATAGASDLPAFAAVVSFRDCVVLYGTAEG